MKLPLRRQPAPTINADMLSAFIAAALVDAEYDPLSDSERQEVVGALTDLAHSIADFWSLTGSARRCWLRLAGVRDV